MNKKPTPTPTPAASSSAQLLAQIQAEIGDAACDSPAQCHSIGVGAKSCGGPEGYLAWSSKRSDEKKLKSLVEQHKQAREEDNRRSGMLSNCMFLPDPGASCVPTPTGQQCRINTGPGGNSGAQ